MCVVCSIQQGAADVVIKKLITEQFTKTANLLSTLNRSDLREFYVQLLRETADTIEGNSRTEGQLKGIAEEIEQALDTKRKAVEAALLKEESEFYQRYGMVMPEDVRSNIKLTLWDSLEQ